MRHPYEEQYLDIAQDSLGEAVDFAVNVIGMDGDYFMHLFVKSGYAEQFERGDPRVLFGMSGTELVDQVMIACDQILPENEPQEVDSYSSWYWAGWILAYYQWESGLPFSRIREFLPLEDIVLMYRPLHEAPEETFVVTANQIREKQFRRGGRLKALRTAAGFSQRQLAEQSGVGIRAIQQYEQGAKRIELASGRNLYSLSQVLQCHMEDLLDFPME